MVDWQRRLWVIQLHKTARTTRVHKPRIIAFPPPVEEMLQRRQEAAGTAGYVFVTPAGRPWSLRNLERTYAKARQNAGLDVSSGEQLVPYTSRHTLLTEAVRAGVTGPQLQALGGWTSLAMAKNYVHLDESDVYQIAMRAALAIEEQDQRQGGTGDESNRR
jgi:integrase